MDEKKTFSLKVFSPEYYDKILEDLKSMDYNNMSSKEIYNAVLQKFQGFPLFVKMIEPNKSICFYRVTTYNPNDKKKELPKSYSYNPSPDKIGRAHLKGEHVFYGSFHPFTCIKEMKGEYNKFFYLSEWKYTPKKQLNIALFIANVNMDKDTISSYVADGLESQVKNMFRGAEKEPEGNLMWYAVKSFSKLFAESNNEYYPITAAIASQCLYESQKVGADIGMLMYSSFTANNEEINLAIRKDIADSSEFELSSVTKYNFYSTELVGDYSSVIEKGFPNEKKIIKWRRPSYSLENINYNNYAISTVCETIITKEQQMNAKFKIGKLEYCPFNECYEYIETEIRKKLKKNFRVGIEDHDLLSASNGIKSTLCIIGMNDSYIKTGNEIHEIRFLAFEIDVKCSF